MKKYLIAGFGEISELIIGAVIICSIILGCLAFLDSYRYFNMVALAINYEQESRYAIRHQLSLLFGTGCFYVGIKGMLVLTRRE